MKLKDFKRIGGYRFELMSNKGTKGYATDIAEEYRSGRRKYNGRKAKNTRVVKTADGWVVYVR